MIKQIGKDYYKQKVGVPQGSVLSAILCSFFYGDLERRKMRFTSEKGSVSCLFALPENSHIEQRCRC